LVIYALPALYMHTLNKGCLVTPYRGVDFPKGIKSLRHKNSIYLKG